MKNTNVKAITNYNTLNLSSKQLEILNCLSKIQNGANFGYKRFIIQSFYNLNQFRPVQFQYT